MTGPGGRIFYGWWVLAGVFCIYMANNGILLYTLPLFYPALIQEFGWNPEEVTRPAAWCFLIAAAATPLIGALFDRFSTRRIMLAGVLVLIVGLGCYPAISSLDQMLAVYIVFAIGLAGCGLVPNMLILTRWFKRRRGLAAGLLLLGSSFGGAVFPLIARETLATQGWRQAALLVAVLGSLMMLAALLPVRNRPEDKGLAADGAAPSEAQQAPDPSASGGPSLRQAMATPAFYILAIITASIWFCIVGLIQHQSIFLGQDLGVASARLSLVFSLFFAFTIAGKLLFAYLSDRFSKLLIMLASVISLTAGLAMLRLLAADSGTLLLGYAAVSGLGFGGAFSMIQLVLASYFAGASFGKILGAFTMIDSLAGFLGIRYLGQARVAQESYLPAFDVLMALCILSAILILVLMRMQRVAAASGRQRPPSAKPPAQEAPQREAAR